MLARISLKADELANQCGLAGAAILGEAGWPGLVPGAAVMTGYAAELSAKLVAINRLESELRAARQAIKPVIANARRAMKKVDKVTDALYGEDSGRKIEFGLAPKKVSWTRSAEPEQVVIRETRDGTEPGSIWVDWEAQPAAVYEVQWFLDASMTDMVGSATATKSEVVVEGLVRGKEYWFRIRAVRGSKTGPWSDQATRVASI
jgi:hypothetical protein